MEKKLLKEIHIKWIIYASAVCVSYIREAACMSGKGMLQRCEMFSGKTYNHFAIAQSRAAEVTKK